MLKSKAITMSAPGGNSCSRSGHYPIMDSDFADFGDFEQELISAIAEVPRDRDDD
ncbi:hypothetical protein ACIHFD_65360 [Nonomuraea sp. NPDC051941]|jgi:hypothetical protein|uniref:hypothetical protein n=1 Tax=Nonomuraea sp. NPDC051941 TaxID=3364373 RepID=UPI0037C4FE84